MHIQTGKTFAEQLGKGERRKILLKVAPYSAINVLPNLESRHRNCSEQGQGSQAVTERLKSPERIPERGSTLR